MGSASKSIAAEQNKDLKLNGENYVLWSMKIRHLLEEQEVLDSLSSVMAKPEEGTTSQHKMNLEAYMAWRKKSSTACIFILSAMDDEIAKQFHIYDNAVDLWIALKQKFGGVFITKARSLAFKFDTYKMRNDHTMKMHLKELSNMMRELSDVGQTMTEEQKIQAVIRSLPDSWDHIGMHLIHTGSIRTFEDAARHLELEEDRLTSIKINAESHFAGLTLVENNSNKRSCLISNLAQEPKKPKQDQKGDKLSAPKSSKYRIFVKYTSRRSFSVEVEKSEKIENVKAKVEAKHGIAPCYQRLEFCQRELEDGKTIGDYHIQVDSTIHLYQVS